MDQSGLTVQVPCYLAASLDMILRDAWNDTYCFIDIVNITT
jgi:hypothetical protein